MQTVIVLIALLATDANQVITSEPVKELSKQDRRIKSILEKDRVKEVGVTSGKIRFTTPGIEKIADIGVTAVPGIIRIMEHPTTSFDTFVRCYGVCQAILVKEKPTESILWYGGVETDDRLTIFSPSGQRDVNKFRAEVIADIRKKLLEGDAASEEGWEGRKPEAPAAAGNQSDTCLRKGLKRRPRLRRCR